MQVSNTGLAAVAALSLLAATARGQLQVFGGQEEDRRASTVVMFGENVMAGVSISYSAPQWKDSYDEAGALDQYKGKNVRLGKNWWASLETSIPLEISGAKLEPGAYVLGLHYGDDECFHLLAIDATQAMKKGMMPFNPDGWSGEKKFAMKLSKDSLAMKQDEMVIAISAAPEDPAKGSLSIQWGKHELKADVKLHVPGAAEAAADKKRD